MNPELQQQVDEHIKRVVAEVHESYSSISANMVKDLAEARLDVMALSRQNKVLQQQAEATSKQLQEALQTVSDQENELQTLRPTEPPTDGDSN